MDSPSPNLSSLALSPYSSPNVGALLKIKIISWSQETGLPVAVRVRVGDRVFELHKHPLLSKSGYFKRALLESTDIELPHTFPGGAEVFEMVALFSYSSSTLLDPFNVAALRCAAEFLEMTEDHGSGNLCERSDLYLNQVVLQNWDDALIVLQKCQQLLPLCEELLIVSRCVESLAFMACMEILDPDNRRDTPVVSLDALVDRAWNSEAVKEIAAQDLWIKDLIAVPFRFFQRIIKSLRRQGMKDKYVSPIIVFYANKWILSKKIHKYWETISDKDRDDDANIEVSIILRGIIDLIPMGEKASRVIPVGFYFALLSKALDLGLSDDSKEKLLSQIASVLHLAVVDDFLVPESGIESISTSAELATMESIISTFLTSRSDPENTPLDINCAVAELWDRYLSLIASDPDMCPRRFMDLVEMVPVSYRLCHDHLYRAMSTFLSEHRSVSQEEKTAVCKYLSCQKLSQEACIEAVQNELMPLRLIVQALFVQQMNTHQAFKDCSDSFRYDQYADFSGSLWSSRHPNAKSQILGDTPYKEAEGEESVLRPLGFLMKKDTGLQRSEFSRKDYESTSFRIQHLEQELISLKRSLQWQSITKGSEPIPVKTQSTRPYGLEGRSSSRKRNPLGQVTSCIGSVSFATQRKYANRLLKVFRRIALIGRGKSSRKSGTSGQRPTPL